MTNPCGLRDYGTGAWDGGDAGCDHIQTTLKPSPKSTLEDHGADGRSPQLDALPGIPYRVTCGKCGATRIDQQLGLEPTPEAYVERMVEVFREVRRVLAPHGTVWLNLGDSYAGSWGAQSRPNGNDVKSTLGGGSMLSARQIEAHPRGQTHTGSLKNTPGLKQKDLVGIPWRVAFALQADGWYLRSDIIWAKPNPMPESVTDRPTKAHEYVFLLSKQPRYFFDQEAVREKHATPLHAPGNKFDPAKVAGPMDRNGKSQWERDMSETWGNPAGRNIRSVWEIATQPYPEAHFATFPEELARRCIAAGCPEQVCRVCRKARERVVESESSVSYEKRQDLIARAEERGIDRSRASGAQYFSTRTTLGFTDCGHSDYRPGIVLDPFMGSGTVAHVARKLGRHSIGIDLSESYLQLAAKRLQQQSLFAEAL